MPSFRARFVPLITVLAHVGGGALVAPAGAAITTYAVVSEAPARSDPAVSSFGGGRHWTIDLRITVSAGDDWTSSNATAEIAAASGGVWFQHPFGGNQPPAAAQVGAFPVLEFDSYFAGTGASFATLGVTSDAKKITGGWFGVPPNGGAGDFLIARFTVALSDAELSSGARLSLNATGTTYATLKGTHTSKLSGGGLASFDIPVYLEQEATGGGTGAGSGGGGSGGSATGDGGAGSPDQPGTSPAEARCLGDLNGDGRRDIDDLPIFLASWRRDAGADLDGDGRTDARDLALFLWVFELPCP